MDRYCIECGKPLFDQSEAPENEQLCDDCWDEGDEIDI